LCSILCKGTLHRAIENILRGKFEGVYRRKYVGYYVNIKIESGRKRPNFVAGKNIVIFTEKFNLLLSTVPYNPDNNCKQNTGKVKGDK
jgi:hypothetical protein